MIAALGLGLGPLIEHSVPFCFGGALGVFGFEFGVVMPRVQVSRDHSTQLVGSRRVPEQIRRPGKHIDYEAALFAPWPNISIFAGCIPRSVNSFTKVVLCPPTGNILGY